MIEVILNDRTVTIEADCSLATALKLWGYESGPFAVAVNNTIVSQAQYAESLLHPGDRIDVIMPMQGG